MNPADASFPGWMPPMPPGFWPARSRADVHFSYGEEADVSRVARRLFGRKLRDWEHAGLAGAPDGAQVEVGTYRGGLHLDVSDPAESGFRAVFLVRGAASELVIVIDAFHIHVVNMRKKGLGLQIFHRQLSNAELLGIRRIKTIAGRGEDENGYYTWPRFGFDGPLSGKIRDCLPPGFERARSMLDLMDCEKGRLWWREHGEAIEVTFVVAAGSRSREVFRRYVRGRFRSLCAGKRKPSSCPSVDRSASCLPF
ncbi:MAG TPA: hypothetical protein VMY42_15290 [Thermoguttaceae bacterium]|nr:hypothetical protein [Thermoguttaceae bacterium]